MRTVSLDLTMKPGTMTGGLKEVPFKLFQIRTLVLKGIFMVSPGLLNTMFSSNLEGFWENKLKNINGTSPKKIYK